MLNAQAGRAKVTIAAQARRRSQHAVGFSRRQAKANALSGEAERPRGCRGRLARPPVHRRRALGSWRGERQIVRLSPPLERQIAEQADLSTPLQVERGGVDLHGADQDASARQPVDFDRGLWRRAEHHRDGTAAGSADPGGLDLQGQAGGCGVELERPLDLGEAEAGRLDFVHRRSSIQAPAVDVARPLAVQCRRSQPWNAGESREVADGRAEVDPGRIRSAATWIEIALGRDVDVGAAPVEDDVIESSRCPRRRHRETRLIAQSLAPRREPARGDEVQPA